MGVEEEHPGHAVLAGGELERAAVVLGLRRLVDRSARLLALVERALRRRDLGLDAELAVEDRDVAPEGVADEPSQALVVGEPERA